MSQHTRKALVVSTLIALSYLLVPACSPAGMKLAGTPTEAAGNATGTTSTSGSGDANGVNTTPSTSGSGTVSSSVEAANSGGTNAGGTAGSGTATATGTGSGTAATDTITPTATVMANGTTGVVTVPLGTAVTIAWSSQNTTACSLSPIITNSTGGTSGTATVTPVASTVYTANCVTATGTVSASVTVTVIPPTIPTVTITANSYTGHLSVNQGTAVTVAWTSQSATQCSVSPGGGTGTSGSFAITMGAAPVAYVATCSGPGGTVQSSVVINLATTIPTLPNPNPSGYSAMLTVNGTHVPVSVPYLTSVSVAWTTHNLTSCTVKPLGLTQLKGSTTTAPLTQTTLFILDCFAGNLEVMDAVAVNVGPSTTPSVSLRINSSHGPVVAPAGSTLTIDYQALQATACTISPAVGGSTALSGISGEITTTALSTPTTYTLTCTGAGGSSSDSVTVWPSLMHPNVTLTINGQTGLVAVPYGGSATLNWTSANVSSCHITPVGSTALSGSVSTGPVTGRMDYYAICQGDFGIVVGHSTVVPATGAPSVSVSVNGSANPITVGTGSTLTVDWVASNVTSCSVTPFGWSGLSGHYTSAPVTTGTVVSVRCVDSNGDYVQAQVPVNVVTVTLGNYINLTANGSSGHVYTDGVSPVQLVWYSAGFASCSFGDGVALATSGYKNFAVTADTTYTLTCTTTLNVTVTTTVTVFVKSSPGVKACNLGINFEDSPLGARDGDFNDFTMCAQKADLYLYGTDVVSPIAQTVVFTTDTISACSHQIQVDVINADGSTLSSVTFNDKARGNVPLNVTFTCNSHLEVTMTPMDGCYNGQSHSMHDPTWAIVKANECRRSGI